GSAGLGRGGELELDGAGAPLAPGGLDDREVPTASEAEVLGDVAVEGGAVGLHGGLEDREGGGAELGDGSGLDLAEAGRDGLDGADAERLVPLLRAAGAVRGR